MGRQTVCDAKNCETVISDPNDDTYVTVMVTVGKGAGTRSLRRDLCSEHVAELADMLDAAIVVDVPVPERKPVDVTS